MLSSNSHSRLVARLLAEMQISCHAEAAGALQTFCNRTMSFDRTVVFLVLLRQNARFADLSGRRVEGGAPARTGISVNAIAESLDRPFETVRRQVNYFITAGICVRRGRGVEVVSGMLDDPVFLRLQNFLHDVMIRLIDDLKSSGLTMATNAIANAPYCRERTTSAALDLILAMHEYIATGFNSSLDLAVVHGVLSANVRPITMNPVLSARFASTEMAPPPELRKPVKVAGLARGLGLPYSTVLRTARRLVGVGALEQLRDGLRVRNALVEKSQFFAGGPAADRLAQRLAQIFQRLALGGFPFHEPAGCYISGRPALVDYS